MIFLMYVFKYGYFCMFNIIHLLYSGPVLSEWFDLRLGQPESLLC